METPFGAQQPQMPQPPMPPPQYTQYQEKPIQQQQQTPYMKPISECPNCTKLKEKLKNTIQKQIAALEIYAVRKTFFYVSIGAIIALFLSIGGMTLGGVIVGGGVMICAVAMLAVIAQKQKAEMNRLNKTYNLKQNVPQINVPKLE